MCPDRQIISQYLDGELPSPWKGKMEAHLSSCTKCQNILAEYGTLGENRGKLTAETVMAAQDRVWKKLAGMSVSLASPAKPARTKDRAVPLRYRSISLPLPVAAAAGFVILIAFIALAGFRPGYQNQVQPQNMLVSVDLGLDDYGAIPMQDMNSVLQYLSSMDNGDFMVVRLPESSNFVRSGQPALINAADYSRTRRHPSR